MNKIFKTFLAASVAFVTVACNLDQVNDIYTAEGNEFSMLQTVYTETELSASLETLSIPVVRSNSAEASTVTLVASLPEGITISGNATEISTENGVTSYNTTVSFAAGEAQSACVLNISAMEVGKSYKGTVAIAENQDVNENKVTMSTSINLAKAYNWISIGEGEYFDNFIGNVNPVEVLKAEGFERYRVVDPYPASVLGALGYGAAGEAWGVGGAACPSFDFWVLEDGIHIAWTKISTTVDYSGSGDTIWQYYPGYLSASLTALNDQSAFIADKVVQFVGYAYIDGMGGFGTDYAPQILVLPGGPSMNDILK